MKFVKSRGCVTTYNTFTNIVLIPISETDLCPQYADKPGNVYRYIRHF